MLRGGRRLRHLRLALRPGVAGGSPPVQVSCLALLAAAALVASGCSAPDDGGEAVDVPTDPIRLLAYNIHHGEGMDEVTDLERIAQFIRSLDPDLVTLQEVDSLAERTGGVDQAAVLGELTGMHAAFGRFMPYQGGAYGMAVLSRWPMLDVDNWRLPDGEEPRTALGVRVREPQSGKEIRLVGIHFYRSEEERLAQLAELQSVLEDETVPVILAGDFNSTPGSPVMNQLSDGWQILSKGDDRGTFPSHAPEREIDFVVLRPGDAFDVIDHRPLDESVISDHRPIWTELRLR